MKRKVPATTAQTISVYPGISIVAQPGTSEIVLGALKEQLAELCESFAVEAIADLLLDGTERVGGDRYSIATVLMEHPERLEQIAEIVRNRRAA